MKRPIGVTLISAFYLFGAAVLLVTAILYRPDADQFGIAARFGVSGVPEPLMRIVVALGSLIMIYGYSRLKRWGFWTMTVYSAGFGAISFSLALSHGGQPFMGNMVWSAIVLFYTLLVYKSFFRDNASARRPIG